MIPRAPGIDSTFPPRREGYPLPAARLVLLAAVLFLAGPGRADPVAVKRWEGAAHGFVSVTTLEGVHIGDGDLVQTTRPGPRGNRVHAQLTVHFKDGSLHQETTEYLQQKTFRLRSWHLVQRGDAFQRQLDARLDATTGALEVRYADEDGKEHELHERLKLPPDVANGMTLALVRNVSPETPKTTVSYVTPAPKARVVQLEITPKGEEPFTAGERSHRAEHFAIHVHVPGLAGVAASALGKVPPDTHVWVVMGEAPMMVKAELALAPDGPVWRIEQEKPRWPKDGGAAAAQEPAGK